MKFEGYITGEARKYFEKKMLKATVYPFVVIEFISVLGLLSVLFRTNRPPFLVYGSILMLISGLILIVFYLKSLKKFVPKKIYFENENIYLVADKIADCKEYKTAKSVIDYGEFYDIVFPYGNNSEKYVCQKNLLVSGTIEEFEEKFKDKIVRKN